MTSSPEPSVFTKAEPEPSSKPEPRPAVPEGEPLPEWTDAKRIWGEAWPIHWIGFTCLFGILTVMTIIAIIRINQNRKKRQRVMSKFSLTVTATLMVFSASRFLYMLIRPYESNQCLLGKLSNCPIFLVRFIFSLGLPSLTSAFMLLHLALLDVMKLQKLSKFSKLQNWSFLLSLVLFSYIFAVTVELVVFYHASAVYLVSICQSYFIIWSACLIAAYLYTGLSIAVSNQKNFMAVSESQMQMQPEIAKARAKNLRKVMELTLATAALAAVYLACQLYSLVVVYTKNSSLVENPDPWPWLGYEYFHRLVECCMAGCLLFNVSYKPSEGGNKRDRSNLTIIMRMFRKPRGETFTDNTKSSTAVRGSVKDKNFI